MSVSTEFHPDKAAVSNGFAVRISEGGGTDSTITATHYLEDGKAQTFTIVNARFARRMARDLLEAADLKDNNG